MTTGIDNPISMSSFAAYIDVAVALPVHKTYTYGVPRDWLTRISEGRRVLVPFGRRRVTGYILAVLRQSTHDEVKAVLDVLDEKPLFPKVMIPFYQWMADYYLHPIGLVIKTALPAGLSLYEYTEIVITETGKEAFTRDATPPLMRAILNRLESRPCKRHLIERQVGERIPKMVLAKMKESGWIDFQRRLSPGQTRSKTERIVRLIQPEVKPITRPREKIIDALIQQGDQSLVELKKIVATAAAVVRGLVRTGAVTVYNRPVYRDPFGETVRPDRPPVLSSDQQIVFQKVTDVLGGGFQTFLLAGVTGSGKTEVYLTLARQVLKRDGQVLVLVPEIALISQVERRFRARFGDRVAVLHSSLSSGERYDQWQRIAENKTPIVIGARSAIFAPLTRLGLVIVDEEHDTAFKQETGLRYNARDLAIVRAKLSRAVVMLGSATPSVQTTFNAATGKFNRLVLPRRIKQRSLPEVKIIDLRKAKGMRGPMRIISQPLHHAMRRTLDRGEQILLFLNRRGFAGNPVCLACGEPVRCRHCDIALTLHQTHNAYKCHYCGFSLPATIQCGTCGASTIRALGIGTEKVEAVTKKLFPKARVERMDRDTTTRKDSIKRILKQIKDGEIDILVGTQMVAKGHDFPNITLVGIICADLSLDFPDFRAGERTFQLLAQVAGRAGRGDSPGRVILQTYNPTHFTIQAARDQDYKRFYQREIRFRKALDYPPFTLLAQLKISGRDKTRTRKRAEAIGETCHALQSSKAAFSNAITILGPIESPLAKISDRYRWQILIKGLTSGKLHDFLRRLFSAEPMLSNDRTVRVAIDVDPYLMM